MLKWMDWWITWTNLCVPLDQQTNWILCQLVCAGTVDDLVHIDHGASIIAHVVQLVVSSVSFKICYAILHGLLHDLVSMGHLNLHVDSCHQMLGNSLVCWSLLIWINGSISLPTFMVFLLLCSLDVPQKVRLSIRFIIWEDVWPLLCGGWPAHSNKP